MKKCSIFIVLFLSVIQLLVSQPFTEAIEDNSYFVEEAYNQEHRVVQHILAIALEPKIGDNVLLNFTQEWPFWGQEHQLSYTIPFASMSGYGESISGIGDVMLNYRYQLTGHDDFVTLAPRLSLILPTGNKDKGLGTGSVGFEFNLPTSKRWCNQLINHFNVGFTMFPSVEVGNEKKSFLNYFVGLSNIWLATEKLNFMLELYNLSEDMGENLDRANTFIVNPGFRYAIDIGDLQIVPGLAVPIYMTKDNTDAGIFLYLSFEHPY